jgi:hypothetical protein
MRKRRKRNKESQRVNVIPAVIPAQAGIQVLLSWLIAGIGFPLSRE